MKRSPMPPRTTPFPPRAVPLAPVSARRAAGDTGAPRKRRDTGPAPEVRKLVLERDEYSCTRCGKFIVGQRYSLGHRKRASQGGQAVPSNLLTFCGLGGEACHGTVDARRDPRDEARGLSLRSHQDPALVLVTVTRPDGSRATGWLHDDGGFRDYPQEARAA